IVATFAPSRTAFCSGVPAAFTVVSVHLAFSFEPSTAGGAPAAGCEPGAGGLLWAMATSRAAEARRTMRTRAARNGLFILVSSGLVSPGLVSPGLVSSGHGSVVDEA